MNTKTQNPYIAIEGVIGVGKTALARLLQSRFQAHVLLEAFDENPFLADFYGDRARYAFQTQLFFLLSRYQQQQTIPHKLRENALLSDYFFAKDKLFAQLNVVGDELEMYNRLYNVLSDKVRWPDLVIYLRANTDTLMARIAMRDRTYEREMDQDYIETLRQSYEALFRDYEDTPLLVIESDEMDFVRNPEDLAVIENRIDAALTGIHQPTLPDIQTPSLQHITRIIPQKEKAILPQVKTGIQINWKTLENYLHLTEAIGRIGGALPRNLSPEGTMPTGELQQAIQDAAYTLSTLAQHTGAELKTNSPGSTKSG